MKSLATTRRAMNTPTVTIAAENTGSPTIGRMAMRSTTAPMSAETTMAASTASANDSS